MPATPITNLNDLNSYLNTMENRIASLESENKGLKNVIDELSNQKAEITDIIRNGIPHTGLLSPSFLQRAFTVWGHYFVAQLIISLVLLVGYLFIMLIFVAAFSNQ